MTTEHVKRNGASSKPGIIGAFINLGAATTSLTIDQVGNAFTALAHPGDAIDHIRDTMQNISAAMDNSSDSHKPAAHAAPHVRHSHISRATHTTHTKSHDKKVSHHKS